MQASYSGSNRSVKYLFENATEVSVEQVLTSGTPIATVTVDGDDVNLYAPAGGGGTTVVANPAGEPTDDLDTVQIGNVIYNIPGSGGSGGNPGVSVVETTGSSGSKTYTAPKDGIYAIFATVTYQGSCTITLPNDAITLFSNDLTVSSRVSRYLIVELTANSTVTVSMSVSQWLGCCSGLIALKNMKIKNVADSTSVADSNATLTLPNDDKMYLVIGSCASRTISDTRDDTTGGNPNYDEKINTSTLSKLHIGLSKGSDSPTYSLYAYDGGIASVIAYELNPDLVYVEANPEGQATEDLDTILIDDTIYNLKGSGYTTLSDYYSTAERVVGRWTDGKPIYQKTIDCGLLPDGNSININTPNNIENLIYVNGYAYSTNDATQQRPVPLSGGGTNDIRVDLYGGVIRIVTFSNWSSYHAIITIQYTKSTDTAGTGPTPGNLVYLPALYSEEEREVGVWTDGKPLYQKTIFIDSISMDSSWHTVNHNISNIEKIQYVNGRVWDDDKTFDIPAYRPVANLGVIIYANNTQIGYVNDWVAAATGKIAVTLQYTKTTDQPGSGRYLPDGQYSHHYSASEHIVGTWIDGSTIYERTWTGLSITTDTSWHTTGIDVSFANRIIGGTSIDNAGQVITESYAHPGYNDLLARSMFAGNTITTITLQYTKSS